jgi:hypothetical protein
MSTHSPQYRTNHDNVYSARSWLVLSNKNWNHFVILSSTQNPAFGPAQVRKFTSLFLEKSLEVSTFERECYPMRIILQLREIWTDLISKSTRKDGKLGLDSFTWLNKVTLDIIGLAGDLLLYSTYRSRRCLSYRPFCA